MWLAAFLMFAAIAAACADEPAPGRGKPAEAAAVVHGFEVVREYPHDAEAFTQGLIYLDGFLYESTGQIGRSSLRKVRLEDGEVIQQRRVDNHYFAEGLTEWHGRLVQLTPMRTVGSGPSALVEMDDYSTIITAVGRRLGINVGSTYDLRSFEPQTTFSYTGEGWGLTHDGRRLIMSDGTSELRFLDPDKFTELGRVEVTDQGQPVKYLNELEFIDGKVYANVWFQDRIAIIDPESGRVTAWIDLAALQSRLVPAPDRAAGAVLNGIAFDAAGNRLFVTGKRWSRLFEIRLRR
jgi:glutaminyl-peptide cyclotransferase